MKIHKPILFIFIGQLILSVVLGSFLQYLSVNYSYSSIFYFFLCIATAAHFIEENSKKIWILEAKVKSKQLGRKVEPTMDRSFFIIFSHTLVIVSFLLFIPISNNWFWSLPYGLSLSLMQMGNGIAHYAILGKFKVNTGVISGSFQIIFGLLVWISLFVPIFP
jgi:hypothetical protein